MAEVVGVIDIDKTIDLSKRITHVITGLIASGFLGLWAATGVTLFLLYGLGIELVFHVYEFVEWKIIRDLVYKQLLENYIGFVLGSILSTAWLFYIGAVRLGW